MKLTELFLDSLSYLLKVEFMVPEFENVIVKLIKYIESENYKGYDPYDALNGYCKFSIGGNWGPAIAIQVMKRLPVNIRPLLGIKKGINPKSMGLFLKAYSILYKKTGNSRFKLRADNIFEWLNANYSPGFSGKCWGYNFDWINPHEALKAHTPSVVVTSFVIDGVFEYYNATKSEKAFQLIISSSNYILNDIPITELAGGISFAYTQTSKGCCYNASLLACEVLAKSDQIINCEKNLNTIELALKYVVNQQKSTGEWWYSFDPDKNTEYKQIDFHQGFVLVSLDSIRKIYGEKLEYLKDPISQGLQFYKNNQFYSSGRAKWRLPKEYPTDIHNQAQGIITFSVLKDYQPTNLDFARSICDYTISNFQDEQGYFYYRRGKFMINKIPYIRWSQAWMFLALSHLYPSSKGLY